MKKLLIFVPLTLLAGCALFGSNAKPPTDFERKMFTVNTQMVNQVVSLTNIIPVIQTNYQVQTISVTNTEHQVVQTMNIVPVYQTNQVVDIVQQTNVVPIYQLSPGVGSTATTQIGGAVAGPFGWGGVVVGVLGGIFSGYMKLRNNALADHADTATQTSTVLAQNIETLKEILKSTPQGQSIMPVIKNYLMSHQAEAGVVDQVSTIVQQTVSNDAAKQAAQQVQDVLKTIRGS